MEAAILEQPVEQAQPERSLMDALRSSRLGRGLALVAVTLSLGVGEAALADSASASDGPQATAVAHEASAQNDWTNYGGNPLFPGGVHSKAQFKDDVLSAKGQTALEDLGLNSTDIKAVDAATRAGKENLKHFPFGTFFEKMTYGVNGIAVDDQGATFEDTHYKNGFEAYDLKVDVVTHKKVEERVNGKMVQANETINTEIELDAPTKCVNISLKGEHIEKTIVPVKTSHKPVKPAPKPAPANTPPAECSGDTTNTSTSSTGAQGGNCSVNTPITTCTAISSPGANVCSTPPTTPTTPAQAPVPPTITFEAAPPAQEQYTDGYTYQDNADVTYPAGDQILVTFGTTNANEGSASTAFQPNAATSPQEWSTEVTMASGDFIDPSFGVIGTITDETTGLFDTVTDTMGTQAMPSLGQ